MTTRSLPIATSSLPASVPPAADTEARALAGDEAAWGRLFRAHNRRVILILLSRGVPADTARDLAQDAWMRLIEQQRRNRLDRLELPGLVVTQALFLARDRARRGDHRFSHVAFDDTEVAVDVQQRILDRSRLQRARALLADGSPSERRVFDIVYARPGVSAAELATATGLSIQRVRQILCEVRKRLRRVVDALGDTP